MGIGHGHAATGGRGEDPEFDGDTVGMQRDGSYGRKILNLNRIALCFYKSELNCSLFLQIGTELFCFLTNLSRIILVLIYFLLKLFMELIKIFSSCFPSTL
jgi:hypothetical protein